MKYTTINEFRKSLILKEDYDDPIQYTDDNIESGLEGPKNGKYKIIFVDYPEFALFRTVDNKYYVYVYDDNNNIYDDYLPSEIVGKDVDGFIKEIIPMRNVENLDEVTENFVNDTKPEVKDFADEFDEPDVLYLVNKPVYDELINHYNDNEKITKILKTIGDEI